MEKYDAARRCPKCGGGDVVTRYRKKRDVFTYPRCEDDCPEGEHLDRRCQKCGYSWPESCVAPEDVKPSILQVSLLPCPRCGYPRTEQCLWCEYHKTNKEER